MNESQPEYLATLVVSFPKGQQRIRLGYAEEFEMLSLRQLIEEMEMLLSALKLDKTIFRSDHASNYLVLKGILSKDKERLLKQVRSALTHPESTRFRAEWQRGL